MYQGRIQDFKLGGMHLKKLRRAEGGAKIFGVFRVKNDDFTQKIHIFSNFRGGAPVYIHALYLYYNYNPTCVQNKLKLGFRH